MAANENAEIFQNDNSISITDTSIRGLDKNVEFYVFADNSLQIEVCNDSNTMTYDRASIDLTPAQATALKEFLIAKGY